MKMTPMQKLLQLPANAVNMVKTVQGVAQGQEEARSPVLTPDGGLQNWYSAVQPEELRHLRTSSTAGGGGGGGDGGEGGGTQEEGLPSAQTQPLR